MANHTLKRTGPKPERLKIKGNWEDAIKKVLKKERSEPEKPTSLGKGKPSK